MKRNLLFTGILLSFLLSCKNQENRITRTEDINIENGLQNLVRLKASDFGKTIRYIPLETTDDGLVGREPILKVLTHYIVIESQRSCLLFNKKDGRFIAEIGHIGQGPTEYNDIYSWTDEKEEFLYFKRRPNQLIKYNMKGAFCGKVEFPTPPGLASYYLISDSEIIGYFNDFAQTSQIDLGFFDKEGLLNDTIPSFFPKTVSMEEVKSINVRKGLLYGTGAIIFDLKDDTKKVYVMNPPRIWKNNGNIRFKEDFIDTIYTVSNKQLTPSIIFNLGKYHWEAHESVQNTNERIYIADISENETFIFFKCVRGLFTDEPVFYNGLYNKKTGETKLSKTGDAIEDDLTHFMPFTPFGLSTTGEFVSLVEAGNIIEWLEEHPEAKNNENLPFLKTLNEEMNPVIILIE
jgi:hypothetical protein